MCYSLQKSLALVRPFQFNRSLRCVCLKCELDDIFMHLSICPLYHHVTLVPLVKYSIRMHERVCEPAVTRSLFALAWGGVQACVQFSPYRPEWCFQYKDAFLYFFTAQFQSAERYTGIRAQLNRAMVLFELRDSNILCMDFFQFVSATESGFLLFVLVRVTMTCLSTGRTFIIYKKNMSSWRGTKM